jgi:hypothetical protein
MFVHFARDYLLHSWLYRVLMAVSVSTIALAAAGHAQEKAGSRQIDIDSLPSPVLLAGDADHAYRDPAVVYHDGLFHMFYTYNPPSDADGRVYWHVAVSTSPDLRNWTPPRTLTPKDQRKNFASPGGVVRNGDEWILCMQTYPIPGLRRGDPTRFGDATARLYVMRSRDLRSWTEPELLRVKGDAVPVEEMGRMIDPFLLRGPDGRWWCFYKQRGASRSWSRDLRTWTYDGRFPCGENVCIVPDGMEYVLFHSPPNGIGVKRSRDLRNWREEGLLLLGQEGWPWARGRLTAGFVLDLRRDPAVGKALVFFHGSRFPESEGGFYSHASIGFAWSDDLRNWDWVGRAKEESRRIR